MTQDQALKIMQMGHNVLLTGAAGTGKTYVLNEFITWLKQRNINVAVTASTGIAATHLGGQTIHSWSGVGIKDELSQVDLGRLAARAEILKRFNRTKVLVIDEVSMVSAQLLDNVDQVLRYVLDVDKVFGGMQVVLAGDLFQLPPVSRDGAVRTALESQAFTDAKPVVCYLNKQHRQAETDPLVEILNAIRQDEVEEYHQDHLRDRPTHAPLEVTRLHSHNAAVDRINQAALAELDGETESFAMTSRGRKNMIESLTAACLAPENLELKAGAEVMFVKNDPSGRYVNGTRGRVVEFVATGEPLVEMRDGKRQKVEQTSWSVIDESGREVAAIDQLPLRLAWAITIHKSQGMSLDEVHVDLSSVFEHGMGYVALSRARSLEGLYIGGMNQMAMTVNPRVSQIDEQLRHHSALAAGRVAALGDKVIKSKIEAAIKDRDGIVDIKKAATKRAAESTKGTRGSHLKTVEMLKINPDLTLKDVAKKRELKTQTAVNHLARFISDDPTAAQDFKRFKPFDELIKLCHSKTAQKKKQEGLKVLREWLRDKKGVDASYDDINLALAWPL